MKVLRDTDGDGTPDVNDSDDDGDGIPDTAEPGHSKERTALTATATNPTNKATEGQAYTSGTTPVVTKNKPNAVISSTETNGLKVNAQGQVEGTPSGLTWTGDAEEQTVSIPVTVSHTGDTAVSLTVEVKVLRTAKNGKSIVQENLLELKEITTEWKDEQGKVLKQAITKSPEEMSKDLSAFEHGNFEGYVFVRTEVKGNVVTHIFRKVTPTKPEGGEQQDGDNKPQPTPETPSDNTERKPEVVTPDEQPAETENTTTKPKASQNILPNTGTAKGVGIFSAAAASILAGLGLIIPVKKEDEEEEETQNNESIQ